MYRDDNQWFLDLLSVFSFGIQIAVLEQTQRQASNDDLMKELQEQRVQIRNVYGNGKEEKYRKNASDIELSIDVLESYYRDKDIDTYVIVTADSDMIPIMSRMMYKGKDVHLFYTKENVSQVQEGENQENSSADERYCSSHTHDGSNQVRCAPRAYGCRAYRVR